MTYRKRNTLFHLLLAALLAGGSSPLRAGVVIKGSVYGGGNEGEVQSYAVVNIEGGTIENNVFGGGNNAGVLKNDTVKMSGGNVKGSIYGGGNLGDVGTTTPITGMPIGNYTWAAGTGECHVMLSGGMVGPAGDAVATEDFPGNVFGGGKGSDYNFWCEKGMVYRTNVSIRKATVKGNVYGGGEIGRVETNTAVTIGPKAENADSIPTIKGSIFGAGKGEKTHGYSALVRGNTEVTVRNGSIVNNNVYGGGEIASVGKYNVDDNGLPYSQANNTSGNCRVNIPGTTEIMGDIFGGGRGAEPVNWDTADPKPKRMDGSSQWETFATKEAYLIYLQTLALATQTEVTIDPGNTESIIQSTKGSVYGGSENGIVQHDTKVTISGNCQIGADNGSGNVAVDSPGNVFGGGKGVEGNEGAGQVSGNATVIINSGTLLGSVYGGGVFGATRGNVTVNINGGTVNHNVYGGGALANTNTANWSGYEEVTGLTVGTSSVTDYYEQSFGGIFSKTKDTVAKAAKTYYRPTTATWVSSTEKSALNKTRVNLRGGKVVGDAFGGALGDSSHEPIVYGDIRVNLNDSTVTVSPQGSVTMTLKAPTDAGCVVNNVFGCNNAKGTPKGDVMVYVYGTQNAAATHIANQSGDTEEATKPKKKGRYDVNAVYGGGNKAAYDPVDPTNNKTQVVIEGCDLTSIDYVYGGGNAAPVPATDVTVNSCYEIHTLFGGGNGSGDGNPGADVGIINQTAYAADNTEGKYGSGTALVKLLGGEIGTVYGGSNERGNIVGGATVNVNNESGDCELKVDHIYGAGNNAKMDGGTDIVLGCMPPDVIEEIYAGARNADVAGDVKLTLTSGTFGRVFGGNKHGGKLMGSITVNIEETGDCTEPLIIGELYGGGNLADYSIYGYKNTGTEEAPVWEARVSADDSGTGPATPYADPRLNIHAFTSIGAIYGGGYRAKMVANPTVDINVAKGSHAATAHAAGTIENIPTQYKDGSGIHEGSSVDLPYPAHGADSIGAIGNVFGGGNLAEIIGDATVNVGTETNIYFKTKPSEEMTPVAEGTNAGLYEVTVEGAIIKGSVYGGGNEANVTGNTQVNICAKEETTDNWQRVAPGTAGVTIYKDVFGAGKGVATNAETALVSGNAKIVMMGGNVKQSVYGGGQLSQVGGSTYIIVNGDSIGTKDQGGEVYGNVYGGGKGNTDNAGGTIAEATLRDAGLIKGNTNITIGGGTILHNIYGGGAHGSVGTFTFDGTTGLPNGLATASTGKAKINITGGTFGSDGHNNGMIFGSSRGDIDRPGAIYDKLAWVYDTEVNIGVDDDATSGPRIWGSVYGSGENGHTCHDAAVTIKSGTIGDPTDYYAYRGNVYGAGCGTDRYHSSGTENHDGNGDKYNHLAGIVQGNATVTINGGSIANNVYGAGSMGKVGGNTEVTINTDGSVGVDGAHDDGNVYGAARGELGLDTDYEYSSVANTTVNISKGTIKGNVFGGGKAGKVKGSVVVNVTGGQVIKDVYGGGALADTNTDNWDATKAAYNYDVVFGLTVHKDAQEGQSAVTGDNVKGYYTKSGSTYTLVSSDTEAQSGVMYYNRRAVTGDWVTTKPIGGTAYHTTTLSLTGGVIGNAYGGGLGQRTGIDGATSDIEAMVYGDVQVTVNGTAFTAVDDLYSSYWYKNKSDVLTEKVLDKEASVPKTGRVFGCNNLNGSPKGDVKVIIQQTKRYDAVNQQVIDGHEINQYEIRGVYGGGNLSHYEPTDGKGTSVEIHNCSNTSIEKVYGGGNAADVPATDVKIYGCFDIHYVFGGGNGADVIYRNGRWEENDGANVNGNASVSLYGGTISDAFIGSDTKGRVYNATGDVSKPTTGEGECALKLTNYYGSSKRADVYGDVTFTVSACANSEIENIYAGSYDAQIHGSINMTITSGILKNVFGGNDRLGSIGGDITINIEEADACKPIIIQNLYGGGFNAPYPGDGATRLKDGGDAANHDDYDDPVSSGKITINVKSCTRIDNIFGGGKGYNATVTGATEINVNMAKGAWAGQVRPVIVDGYAGTTVPNVHSGTGYVAVTGLTVGTSPVKDYYKLTFSDGTYTYTQITDPNEKAATNVTYYTTQASDQVIDDIGSIGNIFGGGDEGAIIGNTRVNIGNVTTVSQSVYQSATADYAQQTFNVLGAHITGDVYGGGNLADVINGNTKVYICTADSTNSVTEGASGVTIAGNVFGGGKGNAQLFTCEKAMVGHDGDGYNLGKGNTAVVIGHGTISGSVFGGGEIARVENNTAVTIGLGAGSDSGTKSPVINGNVFGAGQGIKTHGYSALVRGKSTVTIGGDAWVKQSVYGGGDMASVGRFWVKGVPGAPNPPANLPNGMPYKLKDEVAEHESGKCVVTIQNHAKIGLDNMTMPTFSGHVFGAGKGALPEYHNYTSDRPRRMQMGDTWDPFTKEADYIEFIETLGMSAETDVTIKDNALINGSVYGGSENGHVLHDTYVKIKGGQIGHGNSTTECNHWPYGENKGTNENPKWVYLPYDVYKDDNNDGTPDDASDGHTFYGNVFGGGSGYFPYRRSYSDLDGANAWVKNDSASAIVGMPVDKNGYSDGKWLRSAGSVGGNTLVEITGGLIKTSVYGGNEQTDVGTYEADGLTLKSGGHSSVRMTGGTVGIERTDDAIKNHPVTCYLFGAGKGDQRINFNTWTNVASTKVEVSGTARIYGSVFGGGEDGHVLGNDTVNIGGSVTLKDGTICTESSGLIIGTRGTSYLDGNVFGGGRGFSGEALTAGSVGGNVLLNIYGGTMLGSVYGGGRLASVGIDFTPATDPSYGQLVDDKDDKTHGHITMNISGGTIGNDVADAEYGGNVFGAGMGRNTKLDGSLNLLWPKVATSKTTTVNISRGTIKKNVYGGAEFGIVRNQATVTISGSADIKGSVFGAGKGSDDYQTVTPIEVGGYNNLYYTFTPMLWNGVVSGNTFVNINGGSIGQNVYGGGELASVGLIDFISDKDGNFTNMPKHTSLTDGFGLSWPYKFTYHAAAPQDEAVGGKTIGGKATVSISGTANIGTKVGDNYVENTGYVFGGSKGKVAFNAVDSIAEHRYIEAFCANVKETEVTLSGGTMRTVYGGGDDGHVYNDAKVTIDAGTKIENSVFGGGKGTDTFTTYLWDADRPGNKKADTESAHSWTAGKVYGNTSVTMNGGEVGMFIYGGGNMASVGKGNYSGGADDYSTAGYGETLAGNLWTSTNEGDNAWQFLSSGKSTVTILGGRVGPNLNLEAVVAEGEKDQYIDEDGIPYGSVFGGSRGQAAKSVGALSPRFRYSPDFYLGYVNRAVINIGGTSTSDIVTGDAPIIMGSVYGGGQDGHVRDSTGVRIFKGSITGQGNYESAKRSGNVFGAGSGIGKYTDGGDFINNSSGSVTCTTLVEVYDAAEIAGSVYGGGALASVGPYRLPGASSELHAPSGNHKSCSYTKVDVKGGNIKGSVFGASRGPSEAFLSTAFPGGVTTSTTPAANQYNLDMYATDIWADVNILGGTIEGNVYGGGEGGRVVESTTVTLTGGVIGTASAGGDVFGSGKGTEHLAANVGGDTSVELNPGLTGTDVGCVVRRIFGCNDLNGTPKGHASVHVYATQHRNKTANPNIGKKYDKYPSLAELSPTNYSVITEWATTLGVDVTAYTTILENESATTEAKEDALDDMRWAVSNKKYDVEAVYGGGNLAPYEPTAPTELASVVIDGCELTSIQTVYGGGNAAPTPANSVLVNGTYEIDEVFGGGNGKDKYLDPRDNKWYQNPGANVGYTDFTHTTTGSGDSASDPILQEDYGPSDGDDKDASTPEKRKANWSYGSGVATTTVLGGRLHNVYGGSNRRGNIRTQALSVYQEAGYCELNVDKTYGAGKKADTDGEAVLSMDCVKDMRKIFGGSTSADVYNDITLNITNGTFEKVFGGNDTNGAIYGSITVNIEEGGCQPIEIDELYAGGYLAPYSIYGYETNVDGSYKMEDGKIVPKRTGTNPKNHPRINIISASRIGDVYGGGYQAEVVGDPYINVNMKQGYILVIRKEKNNDGKHAYVYEENGTGDFEGKEVVYVDGKYVDGSTEGTGHSYDVKDLIQIPGPGNENKFMSPLLGLGYINNIFGGGNEADITGNTHVEIGTGTWITSWNEDGTPVYGSTGTYVTGRDTDGSPITSTDVRKAAVIKGSIYGGGKLGHVGYFTKDEHGKPVSCAEGTGETHVLISNGEIGPDDMSMFHLDEEGNFTSEGPDNAGHVFGGGQGTLDYYYDDTSGMTEAQKIAGMLALGTGSTEAEKNASRNAAMDLKLGNLAFCDSTEVIINGTAFVKGSVFGGAENGHVLHNAGVKIGGDCQIGNGHVMLTDAGGNIQKDSGGKYILRGLNRPYSDTEWSNGRLSVDSDKDFPGLTAAQKTDISRQYNASLPESDSWLYGQTISAGKLVAESLHAPHDIFANKTGEVGKYSDNTTSTEGGRYIASDGHTFNGNVYGGGSGYFPYAPGNWLASAGKVEGDTWVEVTGGHILTSLYGGCEMTDIGGDAHITMTGGTVGVPRTLDEIKAHPVTCYVFGGGKGDERIFFNKITNVRDAFVNLSGGWIYGSAFGGGEDGHVMRNVTMNIESGTTEGTPAYADYYAGRATKIGTWGTSYVDGNIFGGGRGFAGDAYTAGNVAGAVTMNITGGEMLGSIYGGGRLGSVGYGLYEEGADGYGEIREDHKMDNGDVDEGFFTKGRGHVEINISGNNTIIGNKHEFQYIAPNATEAELETAKANMPYTEFESNNRLKHTKGGNVFAGGMGRYTQLDGTTPISTYNASTGALTSPIEWKKLGNVKSTKLTISDNPWIMGNVYGGGEFGAVKGYHTTEGKNYATEIIVTGGTIGTEIMSSSDPQKATVEWEGSSRSDVQYTFGSIYGGGMGMDDYDDIGKHGGDVNDSTYISISGDNTLVRASVYGGGEVATVDGNTRIDISDGEIGRNEVKVLSDPDAGYVLFGGATMGNVYGGGKGLLAHTEAGQVKGNTNINISGGKVYHMVYGGGALASVGDFKLSKKTETGFDPDYIPIAGIPYDWNEGTGTANVTITGGTIGISGRDNGLVFGSSRGGLTKPVSDSESGGKLIDPYDKVAWVNKSVVTIGKAREDFDTDDAYSAYLASNTPQIKCSVYGGGENGHNDESATVNVYSGTIGIVDESDLWYNFGTNETVRAKAQLNRGNVYGAGSGSDTYTGDDGKEHWNPKSGMVAGNTLVNIAGGHIGRSVYGGGAMAMVGTIINAADTVGVAKHASETKSFAFSWPYKFEFASGTGKATVNVTGGHIGTRQLDGGDVYGSSRGEAGDRYQMAHLAYTNETEVNITYPETIEMTSETAIQNDFTKQCITGSVHGSGENGYVYGDTKVTLNEGLIGHSLYGAGKGTGRYPVTLNKIGSTTETYTDSIYSLIAGKVMGNTEVIMNGGRVGRNVYGGGNMGSVGKGNYAGGTDDYTYDSPIGASMGYGEKIDGPLWTSSFNSELSESETNKKDNAWEFLNSGRATVKVFGGIVGYIDEENPTKSMKNQLPYGNVFGGSAGEAAPNVADDPSHLYLYSPAFFSGYVNETDVTIGGYRCKTAYTEAGSDKAHTVGELMTAQQFKSVAVGDTANWKIVGPKIFASVYGGGQDGHVRRDTHVKVLAGEIGIPYNDDNRSKLKTNTLSLSEELDSPQWLHRGNIFGGGSGITKYTYNIEKMYASSYTGEKIPASDYSTSSGSVTRFTQVDILGATIHRNVYGGGSNGSVGAPDMGQGYLPYKRNDDDASTKGKQSQCTVSIGGAGKVTIGSPTDYNILYGGEVYGACRGLSSDNTKIGTSVWTKVFIKDGATIKGNVYGGGDNGMVKRDAEVRIGDEVIMTSGSEPEPDPDPTPDPDPDPEP